MYRFKQLRSGNFRHVKDGDFDIELNENQLIEWWKNRITGYSYRRRNYGSRVIKATYSQSQTYYSSVEEFLNKTNENS